MAYGASSLDIEVYSYVTSSDFTEFTGIKEEILLDLGEIITSAGAEFAYPSQTVYVGKDSHADGKKAKLAAAEVTKRREDGTLTLPVIPEAVREEIVRQREAKQSEQETT